MLTDNMFYIERVAIKRERERENGKKLYGELLVGYYSLVEKFLWKILIKLNFSSSIKNSHSEIVKLRDNSLSP
jgi:hypothetical protein